MESRMHGNTHVRFGERDMENHHAETWHGVLSLLYVNRSLHKKTEY